MEYLKPYKNYIASLNIVWHLFCIFLSAGVGYGASYLFDIPASILAGSIFLVVSITFSDIFLAKSALATTEFLSNVILYVSSEISGTAAPSAAGLKPRKEFMERLANYVYDMSSKNVMALYPVKKATDTPASEMVNAPKSKSSLKSPLPYLVIDSKYTIICASQSAISYFNLPKEKIEGQKFFDILKLSFSSDDTLDNWLGFVGERSVIADRSWERVKLTMPDESTRQIDLAVHFSKNDPDDQEIVAVIFDHSAKYGRDDDGASFVAMAVHELRTPLTVMRGYIEVFEEELTDKLDTEQAEFLRNLSAQAQQLGSFVSNIQNLARIESNDLELELKSNDWAKVLNSTLDDMDIRAKVRHKVVKRKIAEDLPAVGIDRGTIYEVIVNLLENAIKYTHTDAPITVSAYLKEPGWVETTIVDQGIGIPDSLIGHIFDKFYRSHRTSKSVGGTGLGLFISKTIVDAHGGQIWVKSKEGEGSTFGFTIPTFDSLASEGRSSDNTIERSAHGWIKNHTLYRR